VGDLFRIKRVGGDPRTLLYRSFSAVPDGYYMSKRRISESVVEAVALDLAGGCTVAKAAQAAKVADSTVHRWLLDPAFRKRVCAHQDRLTGRAVGILSRLSATAAYTLGVLMGEKMEPETRHRAAREVLSQLLNIRTHTQLVERLEALEQRQHAALR
jgi:hypothetical protein